jgi:4-hydroxy-tetrahydrodipicolinate synthase
MEPLKSKDIYGNWASLLLPINEDNSIDYVSLEQEIMLLIEMGVNGIYSNGTAGEFYNQTEDEFDSVNSLLASRCNEAKIPFQIGCNHMSPEISLQRLRRSIALKPSAVQVLLPDWFPPTMEEVIHFLKRMQSETGDIGIVLYNPPHAKTKLQPSDFVTLAEAGVKLVGCKMAGGNEAWYADMKKYAGDLSVFIPGHYLATGISQGAHGAYSNVACLHPLAAQRWYDMMKHDMKSALEMEKRIQLFMTECITPFISIQKFSNQAADKFLAAVGGWANISPKLRWPYRSIPHTEIAAVRKHARQLIPEFFKD